MRQENQDVPLNLPLSKYRDAISVLQAEVRLRVARLPKPQPELAGERDEPDRPAQPQLVDRCWAQLRVKR